MRALLLTMLLFVCVGAAHGQAGERVWRIDTGGDAGSDYSSLSSWDSAKARDLTAADTNYVAECVATTGVAHGAYTAGAGWTTDATRDIKIWTNPDSTYRHNGTYLAGNVFRVEVTNTNGLQLNNINNVFVIGIEIQVTTNTSTRRGIYYVNANGDINIEQCLAKGVLTGGSSNLGFYAVVTNGTATMRNNISWDFVFGANSAWGFAIDGNGTAIMHNNTAYNCREGFRVQAGSTSNATNCISNGCNTDYTAAFDTITDCIDEDGSGTITSTLTFADIGTDDFHLNASDSDAIDAGTDLSGTFTVDIDNETRTGTWDIGADEIVAAAAAGQIWNVINN